MATNPTRKELKKLIEIDLHNVDTINGLITWGSLSGWEITVPGKSTKITDILKYYEENKDAILSGTRLKPDGTPIKKQFILKP